VPDPKSLPIQLTILRQGELNIIDLAAVGSLSPRSETRVDDAFLRDLAAEMRHLGRVSGTHAPGLDLERVGRLIYSHLLTEPARARLESAEPTDLHLRLDEQLVDVPWELCHDGRDFLAMRHRVGRQVITNQPIPAPRLAPSPHEDLRVLLVADPTETLPKAGDEVEQLCALLDTIPRVDVTLLAGKTVRRLPLLAALQAHDVVHFAGHSHYDAETPSRSGWRLADGILTAGELSKLHPPPLLVFSNSCEAGATAEWEGGRRYEGHAFGIGSAFLLAGVRNYVGTFWVVHDEESVQFATSYYGALAAGASLGAALLRARHAVARERGRQGLTWASYLLYGDPTFAPVPAERAALAAAPATVADRGPIIGQTAYRFEVRLPGAAAESAPPSVDRVAGPDALVVGRTVERERLERALEAARRGERGVVFVSGPPGIGKTTLVDAFLDQVRGGDARIGHGQAVEQYGAGEPYLPVVEAWGRLGRGLVDPLRRHAPTWLAQLPSLLEPAESEALQRRAQGVTRERMLREMAELVEAVTADRPLVLALEDLHWSDPSTLELVTYLAQRREVARLLVLATYRPADLMRGDHPLRAVVQELVARGRAQEIQLAPLAETEVRAYLHGRLGAGPLDEGVVQHIHQRTEGHPLFLANVVDFALDQGLLIEGAGGWRLRGGPEALAAVPESLRRMIDRQIETLAPEDRLALEAASVAGSAFEVAAVAAALDADLSALDDRFEGLAWRGQFVRAAGLAEWPDGTVGGRYHFIHALYQNVLYERVAEARRVRLHRRIGERKEAAYGARASDIAGELAAHFAAARDARRAVANHILAGDTAVRRHADREAVEHFTHAERHLAGLAPGPERTQTELGLLVKLATPLMSTKGYAAREVAQVFERAHGLSRQVAGGAHRFPLLRGMVSFYQVRAEHHRAKTVGEELLALCERSDDRLARVQAEYGHGVTLYDMCELDAAEAHLKRALELYRPITHASHVSIYGGYDPGAACTSWLGWIHWTRGAPDRAAKAVDEGLALAMRLGHPFTITFAHIAAAIVRLNRSEVKSASEHVEAAYATAREEAFAYHLGLAAALRGWACLVQGRPVEALAHLEEGLAAHQATGAGVGRPGFFIVVGHAKAMLGRLDEGIAAIDEGIAEAEATHQRLHLAPLYRVRGTLVLFGGDDPERMAEAERCFVRALEVARQIGARMPELQAGTSLASLWLRQGRSAEARALLAPLRAAFTEGLELSDLRAATAVLDAC
jgi:tetratricopeptide (TPR) repeat protein